MACRTISGTQRGHLRERDKVPHYVFLIDISGSMSGDISDGFAKIHAELLDTLAEATPTAITTLMTFHTPVEIIPRVVISPSTVETIYVGKPIASAPSLAMAPNGGNDIGHAIIYGLGAVLTSQMIETEDITAIIVTDGDTFTTEPQDSVLETISSLREGGVKFLYLVAGRTIESARKDCQSIGIRPEEVRIWGHTAAGLTEAFREVGSLLLLGSSSSASAPAEPSLVALPPHH